MCGCIGNCILARAPIRPNSAWKALGVIGPSRSVIKTCEDSPCSRCRRRSARISSPCIGWTLGEPSGPGHDDSFGGPEWQEAGIAQASISRNRKYQRPDESEKRVMLLETVLIT